MPKLRNANTDVGKFVQWMGRKCVNHHPLEELAIVGKRTDAVAKRPSTYKTASLGNVTVLVDDDSILLYNIGGKLFEVKVRKVSVEEYADRQQVKVGV